MEHVADIAARLGFSIPRHWRGVDAVWPILEKMRGEGAIVLLKLDGERTGPGDTGPYTALASGRPLGADPIRTDAHSVEEALTFVIVRYAEQVWGIPRP
jgi:hypothetical protein